MLPAKMLAIVAATITATFAAAYDSATATLVSAHAVSATSVGSSFATFSTAVSHLPGKSIDKRNIPACYPGGVPEDVPVVSDALTSFCLWVSSWVLGVGGYIDQTYTFSTNITFYVSYLGDNNILVDQAECLTNMELIMNDCQPGNDAKLGGIVQDLPMQYEMAIGQPESEFLSSDKRSSGAATSDLQTEYSIDKRNIAACYQTGTPEDVSVVSPALTDFCFWASSWVIGAGSYIEQTYSAFGTIYFQITYLGAEGTSYLVSEAECLNNMELLMNDCPFGNDWKLGGVIQEGGSQWTMAIGQPGGGSSKRSTEKRTTVSCFDDLTSFDATAANIDVAVFCDWAKGKKVRVGENQPKSINGIEFEAAYIGKSGHANVVQEDCLVDLNQAISGCMAGTDKSVGGYVLDGEVLYAMFASGNKPPLKRGISQEKRSPSAASCYTTGFPVDSATVSASVADFCASVPSLIIEPGGSAYQEYGNAGGDVYLDVKYTGATWTLTVTESECTTSMQQILTACPAYSDGKMLGGSVTGLDGAEYFLWTAKSTSKQNTVIEIPQDSSSQSSKRALGGLSCFNSGSPVPCANATEYIDDYCQSMDQHVIPANGISSSQGGTRPGDTSIEVKITTGATGYGVDPLVCAGVMNEIVRGCNVGSDEKQGGTYTPWGMDATFSVQMLAW